MSSFVCDITTRCDLVQKDREEMDVVWCEEEGKGTWSVIINHLFFSDKFMRGLSPHTVLVGHTHPWGEVGFRFKVLPKVLVTFEVPKVSLQGEGCQEEVGLLPLDTL